ncbi:MFS transporter [Nocardioides donggukensis]|uniref:MFS transporter n=1 Tax=Nocardioides donggukensis TaxID=2774019 RepID=A0A927K5A2_9ACTN|nr:MFS transporter [Nocardioides donggukensis]MBD8871002.1 MFS transporter [Nocardioides donggukensis]
MSPLTVVGLRRRFLVLTALRWLPTGLLLPVLVLLPLERGIGLADLGLAFAVQGFVVLALELPTGGLADALGRRTVLLASTAVGLASVAVFLVADSVPALVLVFALQGVYRALDSGPLEAWYVDSALALDRGAAIDRGLSAHGVVLGLAVAGGALVSGGLVALDPVPALDALATPVAVALALQVAGVAGLALLMVEPREPGGWRVALVAARATPATIVQGLALVRGSRVLAALLAVELSWGFAMVTFESLTPVRLQEILGDADAAAAITGPAGSAAWVASAAGAAVMPFLGRRLGVAATAALMRVLQGATVVVMGLAGGVVGVLVGYLLCYTVHGASNPAHMTLLHREATGPVRATVISLNSMVSQPAGSIGVVVLTALAEGQGVSTAMYVGGAVLALAAPLYLPAHRQERRPVASVGPQTPDPS